MSSSRASRAAISLSVFHGRQYFAELQPATPVVTASHLRYEFVVRERWNGALACMWGSDQLTS